LEVRIGADWCGLVRMAQVGAIRCEAMGVVRRVFEEEDPPSLTASEGRPSSAKASAVAPSYGGQVGGQARTRTRTRARRKRRPGPPTQGARPVTPVTSRILLGNFARFTRDKTRDNLCRDP